MGNEKELELGIGIGNWELNESSNVNRESSNVNRQT